MNIKIITALPLVLTACLLLSGCENGENSENSVNNDSKGELEMIFSSDKSIESIPICGGTTDNSVDLPKFIVSDDISYFHTCFYLDGFYGIEDGGFFEFEITQNGSAFTLDEKRAYNKSCPITQEELLGLNDIIKAHNVSADNGLSRVTAGLAPEYSPSLIYADYKSGEKLSVLQNNNPQSRVSLEIAEYLRAVMIRNGIDEAKYKSDDFSYIRADFSYCENGVLTSFYCSEFADDNDVTRKVLAKDVWDNKNGRSIEEKQIDFPENLSEIVKESIKQNKLVNLANGKIEPITLEDNRDFACFYFETAEDITISCFLYTDEADAPSDLMARVKASAETLNALFED